MKLFIGQFDSKIFEEKLGPYNLDLSIFLDILPTASDLSKHNIIILQEPNEYFQKHTWVLQNAHVFDLILTYNDLLLNTCANAGFVPFGSTWLIPDQYKEYKAKKFQISHLCGKLLITYGHSIRHEILNRQNEIKLPKKFYHTYGNRDDIAQARINKEEIFGDSQYGIAIENTSHNGYFTEKIVDLCLMRTIPVYWGCSDITDFFEADGIITIQNPDDAIRKINLLTPNFKNLSKDL